MLCNTLLYRLRNNGKEKVYRFNIDAFSPNTLDQHTVESMDVDSADPGGNYFIGRLALCRRRWMTLAWPMTV